MTQVSPNHSPLQALSVREAAERIGICKASMYQLMWSGRIVPRKFGKRTLILSSDLDAFLTALPRADLAE